MFEVGQKWKPNRLLHILLVAGHEECILFLWIAGEVGSVLLSLVEKLSPVLFFFFFLKRERTKDVNELLLGEIGGGEVHLSGQFF